MSKPVISVIIPMYNEEEVIAESYRRLNEVMGEMHLPYELVFINDGSQDRTMEIMEEIQAQDGNVKVLGFARNFGHQIAVTAGMDFATGDAVVIIDADLQDPPEVIPKMVDKWREGFDVVYGKRQKRKGETIFKKFSAFMFYRVMRAMTGHGIPADTGDFRLMDARVVKAMKLMPEHARFLRGMVSWVGFKQTPLLYVRDQRWAGKTKYPLKKMLKLAIDGILSFSSKPLSMIGGTGGLLGMGGLIYLVWMLVVKYGMQGFVDGYHFAIAAMLMIGGVILVAMGVLGAYIGRIYDEAKGRPLYLVAQALGFEGKKLF